MKLFGLDFSKKYDTRVATVSLPVTEDQINSAGGEDTLGSKVWDLWLAQKRGVMHMAFFPGKSARVRIMYFVKAIDQKSVEKWLENNGIFVEEGEIAPSHLRNAINKVVMKLFSIDLSQQYKSEVATINFLVTEDNIKRAGGEDKLGSKVSDLELSLPRGVMNTAYFSGKSARIEIMYSMKSLNNTEIEKWLKDNDIPFTPNFKS